MMPTVKVVVFFAMFMLGAVTTDMAGECDMVGFYLELGCTPIPNADNSSLCPEAFTCPDLHPDPNMCYYRGIPYGDQSALPQDVIKNQCSQYCSCHVINGEVHFECAVIDCKWYFYNSDDCISTYSLDSCCSGRLCGKDAIEKLKTCNVDGKYYKEGTYFEPKNTLKACVCTSDWDGTVNNRAYCKDINCGLEIYHQNYIFKKCAPVFFENRRGCPIGFECPSPSTKVIRGLNQRVVDSQCVFGNVTLNVGDKILVEKECTKCICDVPPFVSCTRQNVCT